MRRPSRRRVPVPFTQMPQAKVANTMKRRSAAQRFASRLRGLVDILAQNILLAGLAGSAATLLIIFFIGLAILSPSSPGTQIEFSQAESLISTNGSVEEAKLLDQDARIELK